MERNEGQLKVSKCFSLAIQELSGNLFDPHLTISQQKIPFATVWYQTKLHDLLKRVDGCPLTIEHTLTEVVQSCSVSSSHLATLNRGIFNILGSEEPGSLKK